MPTPRWGVDSCAVWEIQFPGDPDLGGSLHPEISKLTALEILDLDETNVAGSLEVLANNTKLEWLQLRHSRVAGQLEDLSKAKDLRGLDLTGTEVAGDLAALAHFTELKYLSLSNTAALGELKSLSKLERLQTLQLRRTRVGGRLEDLSNAKDLQNLDLTGAEVTGDVAALANARLLKHLSLSNTAVSGELKSLAQLNELKKLDLANVKVAGELKSLAQLERLTELDLSETAVSGELKSLAKLERLTELDLSNTAVSGELKSLAQLNELKQLELANLKVVGDAAVMAEWSKIEHIDISGTEVEFVKTNLLQQFQLFNEMTGDWQCPWQELRFLGVSRTSQFSQAQDLLRPLAGCGNLATLKAAGCGLTGPVWPEIFHPSFGRILSIYEWPLSQALSVLDLASNNVTDVAKLPRSCRTLVLTGRPHVSFGAGVLEKAIKNIVFIDLRNATFANLSDSLLLIGQLAVIYHLSHMCSVALQLLQSLHMLRAVTVLIRPKIFGLDRRE